MLEGQPEPQAPKTINLSRKGLGSNERGGSLSALLHSRYIQDSCVLASAATGLDPTTTGQAPKLLVAQTARQTHEAEFDSGGLCKSTRQVTILAPVPANNTTKDSDAVVQGALPQSLLPQMPFPGSLLQHPTPEPSPMWCSAPLPCPALSPYPVSTLPLPPLLKARQTYGYCRWTPPIKVSPPALDPLQPPLFGQAGTDDLFSLARQYGACVERCASSEPKHPKQELSTKRRTNGVAAAVYNFLGASIMSNSQLQAAQEWVHQTVSSTHKCSSSRHSTGRSASNAKNAGKSMRRMRHIPKARKTKSMGKRSVALHHCA